MTTIPDKTYSKIHREHMRHEIEQQDRQWKALNRKQQNQRDILDALTNILGPLIIVLITVVVIAQLAIWIKVIKP